MEASPPLEFRLFIVTYANCELSTSSLQRSMAPVAALHIHDLPAEVLSLVLASFPVEESSPGFPFLELRLVCRLWNKIASPHLFRSVRLGRGRQTFQRWRRLLSRRRIRKHIQHLRIDCQNDYPPYHKISEWKRHFATAIGHLKDLEKLNGLTIHFEKSCDLEGWHDGVTSKFRSFFATGARMWILSKVVAALKERAPNRRPIRSVTIDNLQNFPAWSMEAFDEPTDISFLSENVRELDLTFVAENYTELYFHDHDDWDPGKLRRCNFTPYLRTSWLATTASHLTSLSISSVERWGSIPSHFDGKGLDFPQLKSLMLGNFIISHHDQFDWVLRQKSLSSLRLVDNAILSYIFYDGVVKEETKIPIHDWIMLGDSRYYFPGVWETFFDRINEELPRLTDFLFRSDAGIYPPRSLSLGHVRYISFHSCDYPIWDSGARTDGDFEWDWTTNRAQETFQGDTRAHESLVQKVQERLYGT